MIDADLGLCVRHFYRQLEASELGEKPRSLKFKIDFLRTNLRKIDHLSGLSEEGLALLDEISSDKPIRDSYAHIYLADTEMIDDGIFLLSSVEAKNDYEPVPVHLDARNYPDLLDRFLDLAGRVTNFRNQFSQACLKSPS